jgi:XTP/dITP diphosphohydrolase
MSPLGRSEGLQRAGDDPHGENRLGRPTGVGVLLIASANRDKAREIVDLLAGLPVELRTAAEVPGFRPPEETGATLEDNAILKARCAFEATGLPSLADDTGLEVQALGGRPGVRSSRYAGEGSTYADNVALLLREMAGVEEGARGARFVTVVALYRGDGRILLFEGRVEGRIAARPRGTHGFGYDPVFLVPAVGKTLAEMTPAEKARHGHRGAALRKLRAYLEGLRDPAEKAAPTDGLGHLEAIGAGSQPPRS